MIKKGTETRAVQRERAKLKRASKATAAARRRDEYRKGLTEWVRMVGWPAPGGLK